MQGEVWQLRQLHDERAVLGEITITESDFPWLFGTFAPQPDFASVAPLFAAELTLSTVLEDSEDEADLAAWEAAYDEIARSVTLVSPNGPVADFLLHIDGSEAWFRWID
jgi:hypothetical protein